MIRFKSTYFDSEEEFMNGLRPVVPGPSGIMAGHYMLLYHAAKHELVPMIEEELEDENLRAVARLYAGGFPLRTLKYGLELRRKWLKESQDDTKLVFLVNDHRFHVFADKEAASNLKGERAKSLRADYYNRANDLPRSFSSVLRQYANDYRDAIFKNRLDNNNGDGSSLGNSLLFSEMRLRNKFMHGLPKTIGSHSGFSRRRHKGRKGYDVFFKGACLTEEGECGCSGETVELLRHLLVSGLVNIALFVPSECASPVKVGAQAALSIIAPKAQYTAAIDVIEGVGGCAEAEDFVVEGVRVDSYRLDQE